jgi:hypothetical protein
VLLKDLNVYMMEEFIDLEMLSRLGIQILTLKK